MKSAQDPTLEYVLSMKLQLIETAVQDVIALHEQSLLTNPISGHLLERRRRMVLSMLTDLRASLTMHMEKVSTSTKSG